MIVIFVVLNYRCGFVIVMYFLFFDSGIGFGFFILGIVVVKFSYYNMYFIVVIIVVFILFLYYGLYG